MSEPTTLGQAPLEYAPLPQAAFEAARDGIVRRGFARQAILTDYGFSTRARQHIRVNALAFAHPVHRTPGEYAGISLYNAVNGANDSAIVEVLAGSSAPFHLIHRDSAFALWTSTIENKIVRPVSLASAIAYDHLDRALADYEVDLRPERIVDVKRGREGFMHPRLRDVRPRQLALWALDVTRPLLVERFGAAVRTLRDHQIPDEQVATIATQLLGAVVLADTGVLGADIRPGGSTGYHELLGRAADRFPGYFQDALAQQPDGVTQAYTLLREISYAGFEPDMLTELYTAAYSAKQRKMLGRYDTPLYLARRIWETIPIEQLPPDRRVVADMTCGWGSFLIAGYERLAGLVDMQDRHLRDYLHGNDIDPFTTHLARLGLLLATSDDSWHIDHGETSSWSWLAHHQPDIIVGNPPFSGDRKRPIAGVTKRHQKADEFLQLALNCLAPDGYLAMVMPHSFVAAQSAPELRKQLLEECDVLELWDLPYAVFADATSAATVIFARKRATTGTPLHAPVRGRTLQDRTLEQFKAMGTFTASSTVRDQANWTQQRWVDRSSIRGGSRYVMDFYSILTEAAWAHIHAVSVPLTKVVECTQGAIRGTPERPHLAQSKSIRWLPGRGLVNSFAIDYDYSVMLTYPSEFNEPRLKKENFLVGTKILLSGVQNDSWGHRANVAIERHGYYPSHNFWVLAPRPKVDLPHITHLSHEVVAAVLYWYVSNAWIVEHLKSPYIQRRALLTIPFPRDLTERDCAALEEAVLSLEEAATAGRPLPDEALAVIDQTLIAAYHLDDETYRRLRIVAEWSERPDVVTLDPQSDGLSADWAVSGVVTAVDPANDTITLWLEGFDTPQVVPIAPGMPGWMLRSEVAFQTVIPREAARYGQLDPQALLPGPFRPQPYAYLDEQQLLDELALALHADSAGHGNR